MHLLTIALFAAAVLPAAQNNQSPSAVVSAAAVDPALPAPILTIEQALALAEKNSPLLHEAAAGVERARAGIRSARAYTNPTAEYLAGQQSARPIATPGVPGLLQHWSAGQTIEIPSERRTRIQASKLDLTSSEYLQAGTRLSVVAEVKHAFFDVLRSKERIEYAKQNLGLVEELRRRVGVEVQVGEKGRLELTRAEAEMARARTLVSSAEVELARSQALLKAVIGAPAGADFDPQGTLEDRVKLAPLDELRQRVLAQHPALAEAKTQTSRGEALVANQRALRIPQPNFYGEYERQPDLSFYRFGVSMPLPLWDRRKGPIAEAQAEVKRAQAVTRRRELELTASLERAYDEYQLTDQQVESLQAGSLREAQAAVDAALSAYKFGERGILEVLDAQRVLQSVRDDLLNAMYERQSALIDLEELGGK